MIGGKKKSAKHPPKAPPIDKAGPALGKKRARNSGIPFDTARTISLFFVGSSFGTLIP